MAAGAWVAAGFGASVGLAGATVGGGSDWPPQAASARAAPRHRPIHFEVDGGVGETFLNLPTTGSRYGVKLDGGVGATHITIADGAALNLKIDAGVGAVDIHLPATAAVRLEGDGGVGGVSVPPSFNRVRGSGSFIGAGGVWETTGFSLAANRP